MLKSSGIGGALLVVFSTVLAHGQTLGSSNLSYVKCAQEWVGDATCDVGEGYFAFGTEGYFNYLYSDGAIPCNYGVFGDPLPYAEKSCYFVQQSLVGEEDYYSEYPLAGDEGEYAYGANGQFAFATVNDTFYCNPDYFGGDPIWGYWKSCYRLIPQYRRILSEGQSMDLGATPHAVAFGAQGKFAFALKSGQFACNASSFENGSQVTTSPRYCYALKASKVADEWGAFRLNGCSSGETYFTSGRNGIVLRKPVVTGYCNASEFGADPDPGYAKSCFSVCRDPGAQVSSCSSGAPNDWNICTQDICDPVSRTVGHVGLNWASCNDGNPCTTYDFCWTGTCQGADFGPGSYADSNPCDIESCSPSTGITHTPVPVGTTCNDGHACTQDDACNTAGSCAGSPVIPPANTQCVSYGCVEPGGVQATNLPSSTACNADNNPCTLNDHCNGSGACIPGSPSAVENDGRPCTVDSCDPQTGATIHTFVENGTVVSGCTGTDVCDGAGRCAPPMDLSDVVQEPAAAPGTVIPLVGSVSVADFATSLYTGPDAIQKALVENPSPLSFDQKRLAVIQGRVLAQDGFPLANVWVQIKDHPEYGYTKSRVDGNYTLAVEGGGWLTVNLSMIAQSGGKDYFPVQRAVNPPWGGTALVGDAVMTLAETTPPLAVGINVPSGSQPVAMSVHQGAVTPANAATGTGRRGTVLLFPPGVQADVISANASTSGTQPATLSVGTTEYTRDLPVDGTMIDYPAASSGVLAMPGELPLASAYTYAVDLFDAGQLGDATRQVKFTDPNNLPILYVDNFLNFEVGAKVPVGSYNRDEGAWQAENNGVVLKIVAGSSSTLEFSIDDNGTADAVEGVSTLEKEALYKLVNVEHRYSIGDTIWRTKVAHFSPWDLNWPYAPEQCGEGGPCSNDDPGGVASKDSNDPCPSTKPGSTIRCESRILGESIPLAGTPWELVYSSDRAPGYRAAREVEISLPGMNNGANNSTRPNRWLSSFAILVGGAAQPVEYLPEDQTTIHLPIPKDPFGNVLNGTVREVIGIVEHYPTVYAPGRSFGLPANGPRYVMAGMMAPRSTVTITRYFNQDLTNFDARLAGLGGWDLSIHHWLDRVGGWVFRGDGSRQKVAEQTYMMERSAMGSATGSSENPPDGANWSLLRPGQEMVFAPNGDLFVGSQHDQGYATNNIYLVSKRNVCSAQGDPGPCVRKLYDAFGGSLYPVDSDNVSGFLDPASSTVHVGGEVEQMAIGPDGSLYVAFSGGIFKIYEDKTVGQLSQPGRWKIRRISGGNWSGSEPSISGIDGAAKQARAIGRVRGIAIGGDESIYLTAYGLEPNPPGSTTLQSTSRLLKIGQDGTLRNVIGGGAIDPYGAPSTNVAGLESFQLKRLWSDQLKLDIDAKGDLYFVSGDSVTYDLLVMRPQGKIELAARGTSENGNVQLDEGVLAAASPRAFKSYIQDVGISASGAVLVNNWHISGLREIDTNGIIRTLSGNTVSVGNLPPELNEPPVSARLTRVPASRLSPAPNGDVLNWVPGSTAVYRMYRPDILAGGPECPYAVPSSGAHEVYCFDETGRHLNTRDGQTCSGTGDPLTCTVKYRFAYVGNTGVLSGVTDAAGNVTSFATVNGNRVVVAPPLGGTTALVLSSSEQRSAYLTRVEDPEGQAWNVTMTEEGLLTNLVDPKQSEHIFDYDSLGKLQKDSLKNASGQTISGQKLSATAENAILKSNGVPLSPQTRITNVTHESTEGLRTTYETRSEASGKESRTTTYPTGLVSSSVNNPDGTTTITSPNGEVSTVVSSADPMFGNNAPLTKVTTVYPSSSAALTVELKQSHSLEVFTEINTRSVTVGPSGAERTTTMSWDPFARTLRTVSPKGRSAEVTLDNAGRVTAVQEPGFDIPMMNLWGNSMEVPDFSIARDQWTQNMRDTSPDTYGYLATVLTPDGASTSFSRDRLGRVLGVTQEDAAGADSNTTGFSWDPVGNLSAVSPPGRPAHSQEFDAFGQQTRYVAPTGSVTTFKYDGDRDLRLVSRPGREPVTYVTSVGRLVAVEIGGNSSPNFRSILFGYKPNTAVSGAGNLDYIEVVAAESPRLSYQYNGSLPVSERYEGPVEGLVSREFDAYLNVSKESVAYGANSASDVSFGRDEDGVVTSTAISGVPEGLSVAFTDASKNYRPATVTLGSTVLSTTYDRYGEVASNTYNHGATNLLKLKYEQESWTPGPEARDAMGRIWKTSEVKGTGSARSTEYLYDYRGQLTTVKVGNNTVESYAYDPNGNRTDVLAGNNGAALPVYDSEDRLLSYSSWDATENLVHTWDLTYAPDGTVQTVTNRDGGIFNGTSTYTYDELGNLTHVVTPTKTIDYIVDGRGRRIAKKVGGVVTKKWLYDGQLRIVAEIDASGAMNRFVYATRANIPDYMVKYNAAGAPVANGVYRIIADHLGSPRLVVNVTNESDVIVDASYSAFGIPSGTIGAIPFGFAGGLYDADTELVRFGVRDYDARFGRWTAKDPILFGGGQANLYVYVGNDPVNWRDESGLAGVPGAIIGGIVGAVASGIGAYLTGADAGQIAMAAVIGFGIGAIGGLIEPGVGTSAGIGAASGVVSAIATGGGYGSMALSGLVGAASGAVGAMAPGVWGIVVGALTGFAGGMAAAGPGAEIDNRLKQSTPQSCPSSR